MSDAVGDIETPETAATSVEVTATDGVADRAFGEEEGAVTEETRQSYCGRLGSAFSGACIGLLLFFGSIGLLVYNEGRTVKRAIDIDEGREVVVELNLDYYNTTSSIPKDMLANQLVHAVGDLSTTDTLMDPVFGVGEAKSLKLSRSVEMYQWKESTHTSSRKTSTGSTITTTSYSYSKKWLDYIVNSNKFHNSDYRNTNPTDFPFPDLLLAADPIFLGNGGIQLSSEVASYLNWFEPVDSVSLDTVVDSSVQSRLEVFERNGLYYHSNGASSGVNNPVIGDARFTFDHVPADTISIIAVYITNQGNDSPVVDTYTTSRGGTLLLVKRGNYTSQEMFQQADDENTTLAWVLRFVGFFLMVISILLILQPLATAVDIIPFVGDYLQGGLEGCIFPCIALLIALPVSLFTVALAWLAYRPAWSVPILVASGGVMAWLYCRAKKAKQDAEENNANDSDGIDKPPANDFHNEAASASAAEAATSGYPYGSIGKYDDNDNNTYTATTSIGASSMMTGGFAGALDNPPPTAPQLSPVTAIPMVEPDVVMGQSYNPTNGAYSDDVEANNKPFVPQVYKP